MELSMKTSFSHLGIVAAVLLLLAISCQQTNKGGSKSGWQLQSPGTAAGYGKAPMDSGDQKESDPGPPAAKEHPQEAVPSSKNPEPTPEPPSTKSDQTDASAPALMIAPPPSAPGYGRPPVAVSTPMDTAPAPDDSKIGQKENGPAVNQPPEQQPVAGGEKPAPSEPVLHIVPPPSAAGYGSHPLYGKEEKAVSPAPSAAEKQQPANPDQKTLSSSPAIKIVPPPSAAGYGRPPLDIKDEK